MISELMNVYELEEFINKKMTKDSKGLLFCFGTSFISKLIQAKTRLNPKEYVPSHVLMLSKTILYESTTSEEKVGFKKIKEGVRRWQVKDFLQAEKGKVTKYIYIDVDWNSKKADEYVHLPYGKDTILDFLLKDGSDGDSHGLICSQYANLCTKVLPNKACPNPAELYRRLLLINGGLD